MSTATKPAPITRPAVVTSEQDAWAQAIALTRLGNIFEPSECRPVTLSEVAAEIRGRDLESKTNAIRRLRAEKRDAAAYKKKVQLPAVMFAGQFQHASNSGLTAHARLLMVDFDKVPKDRLEPFRKMLALDPHTAGVFTSSSGVGVKWLVAVNATDGESHGRCFDSMQGYVREHMEEFAGLIDEKCRDVSRKCFLSFDPFAQVMKPTKSFEPEEELDLPINEVAGCHTGDAVVSGNTVDLGLSRDLYTPLSPNEWAVASEWIAKCVPTKLHDTHGNLFDLGRLVLKLELNRGHQKGALPLSEKYRIFDEWIQRTRKEFRFRSDTEYRMEFLESCKDAKTPIDVDPLELAWSHSTGDQPKDAFEVFPDNDPYAADGRRVVAVAYRLASERSDGTFFRLLMDLCG